MAHPNKREAEDSHNARLRMLTRDYGSASGPKNNILAPTNLLKAEGPEDEHSFGSDSSASRPRSDRPARKTKAANPIATLARGGKVCRKADGGDVSSIEEANRDQAMTSRASGGRANKKHGQTHVNVIFAPGAGGAGPGLSSPSPMPLRPPVLPPTGGPPVLPAGGPPTLPPGVGAVPPMPPHPLVPPMGAASGLPMAPGAPGGMPPGLMPPRARGGRVHGDEAEDRALFNKMFKEHDKKRRADGGEVEASLKAQGLRRESGGGAEPGISAKGPAMKKPHLTAGAFSGIGRLEKMKHPGGHQKPQPV